MRQIKKHFDTQRQAERYLYLLYGAYDYARLIQFPMLSESGTYVFEVH